MRQTLKVSAELQSFPRNGLCRALAKAGSERVEDAALGAGFLQNPVASDYLT